MKHPPTGDSPMWSLLGEGRENSQEILGSPLCLACLWELEETGFA